MQSNHSGHYHAGWNVAGFPPESFNCFSNVRDALDYLVVNCGPYVDTQLVISETIRNLVEYNVSAGFVFQAGGLMMWAEPAEGLYPCHHHRP